MIRMSTSVDQRAEKAKIGLASETMMSTYGEDVCLYQVLDKIIYSLVGTQVKLGASYSELAIC